MPTSHATVIWIGDLPHGAGKISGKTGAFTDLGYSLKSRLGEEPKTSPEELLGAAHAACFSMMVSALATGAGLTPTRIHTTAAVTFGPDGSGGFAISGVALDTEAAIPGLDDAGFQALAQNAKTGCPVSKALTGVSITLTAKLVAE